MLKVLYKKPQEPAVVIEVENRLEKLQELVEGYIEEIQINRSQKIICLVNEEGLLRGLKPNITLGNITLVGNIVFLSFEGEEFSGLSEQNIHYLENLLSVCKVK